MRQIEERYAALVSNVLRYGEKRPTTKKLKDSGKPVGITELPHQFFTLDDINRDFPILGSKYVDFHKVKGELLWFLSGSTNVRDLHKHNIHYWDPWANSIGELGPTYGKQWREWEDWCVVLGSDPDHIDQIKNLIDGIDGVKKSPESSDSRRLIVTAWNPVDLPDMKLPPCHYGLVCHVDTGGRFLDMLVTQRSADLFLGVPYNIASYALLTHMLACFNGLQARRLSFVFANVHVYKNHRDQLAEQKRRLSEAQTTPVRIRFTGGCADIDGFKLEHMHLEEYNPLGPLHGEVAV